MIHLSCFSCSEDFDVSVADLDYDDSRLCSTCRFVAWEIPSDLLEIPYGLSVYGEVDPSAVR